ncbi:MAG TPA: hypothetical protein VJ752_17585 [Burkholderiaceae bacterium]|nr:hypothetical protein [Burkholderiaceae bacterium]
MTVNAGSSLRLMCSALLCLSAAPAIAQDLDIGFSCSVKREDDTGPVIYADSGKFRLDGNQIREFYWESSLFHSTHGFDCSIDQGDGLQAETTGNGWRVTLANPRMARDRRGYDWDHGLNCSIRLEPSGDTLQVKPSCPALCGSRSNFSALSVDLKTGNCHIEE